jgi:hypothetical protein
LLAGLLVNAWIAVPYFALRRGDRSLAAVRFVLWGLVALTATFGSGYLFLWILASSALLYVFWKVNESVR